MRFVKVICFETVDVLGQSHFNHLYTFVNSIDLGKGYFE